MNKYWAYGTHSRKWIECYGESVSILRKAGYLIAKGKSNA